MRLTPAQLAVHLICGEWIPMLRKQSLKERIAEGRRLLVQIAGVDFQYDLQHWHDHLKESRAGGYTWNRTIALPNVMANALASEEWRQAVRELESSESRPRRRKKH